MQLRQHDQLLCTPFLAKQIAVATEKILKCERALNFHIFTLRVTTYFLCCKNLQTVLKILKSFVS